MMSGQLILSDKPFSTFFMARLSILQLRLTLTPLFTTTKDPTPAHKVFRDRMTKKWMQFHVSFLSEADEMHTRK
jgi:hypothetical protein